MRRVVLLALLLCSSGTAPHGPAAPPILVCAAVSLTDAFQDVEQAYLAAGGARVRFNFAASNVLARQIANGAPADVFISADDAQMDYALDRGAIDAGSRIPLLRNRLAVVVPVGARVVPRDARALVGGGVRKVAIGDPAAVPVGVYARRYLERTGIWDALQRKLLPLSSARATLAAVESGGADAGFVYESDVASTSRARLAFVIDGPDAPAIVYPAAITTKSKHREAAARFLAFLRGPEAASIFRRHRFGIDG